MANLMARFVYEVAKYTNTHFGYNTLNFRKMKITRRTVAAEVAGIAAVTVRACAKKITR